MERTLQRNDSVRRSSAGETLSTRLSTFRRSITRHRHSSMVNRNERRRQNPAYQNVSLTKSSRTIEARKPLASLCPCWTKSVGQRNRHVLEEPPVEPNNPHDMLLAVVPESTPEDDPTLATASLVPQIHASKGAIDSDGHTCDTIIMKHDNEEDEPLSDENDVTIQQSSFQADPTSVSSNHTPSLARSTHFQRPRANSEGCVLSSSSPNQLVDRRSLT